MKTHVTAQSRNSLTAAQKAMVETWETHTHAEFALKSVEATLATMTDNPTVMIIPVMIGGVGLAAVRAF